MWLVPMSKLGSGRGKSDQGPRSCQSLQGVVGLWGSSVRQRVLQGLGQGDVRLDCHFKKIFLASLENKPWIGKDGKRDHEEVTAIIRERNPTASENSSGNGKKRSNFTYMLTKCAKGSDVEGTKSKGGHQRLWFRQLCQSYAEMQKLKGRFSVPNFFQAWISHWCFTEKLLEHTPSGYYPRKFVASSCKYFCDQFFSDVCLAKMFFILWKNIIFSSQWHGMSAL